MPRRNSSPPSPRVAAKRDRGAGGVDDNEDLEDRPLAPPRPGSTSIAVVSEAARASAPSQRLYSAKLSPLLKPLRSPVIHPLPGPRSTSLPRASSARSSAAVSSLDPTAPRAFSSTAAPTHPAAAAAPTANSPRPFESLFSQPEIRFQLEADRGRSSLLPRDVASLTLWALPTAIPLVECPKWAFLKNRSHCRGVTVIYCNGVSYDVLMNTGAGVAAVATPSDASSAPTWSEAVCSATLSPLRRACSYAYQNEVFHAPMWVPSQNDRLELDFFLRTSPPPRRAAGGRNESNEGDRPGTEAATSSAATSGGSSGQLHARSTGHPTLLDIAKACATGAVLPVVAPATPSPPPSAAATASGSSCTGATEQSDPGALGPLGAHFSDYERLMEFAINTESHEATLRELQFVLDPPTDEQHLWKSCDRQASGLGTAHQRSPTVAVYAMDCEMVQIADGIAALARCTVVRLPSMDVVLDMLVKPDAEIVDYVTRFSGITPAMLDPVTTRLADAQEALLRLFCAAEGADDKASRSKGRRGGQSSGATTASTTTTFVVGHSLENDFKACKLIPHGIQILDTAHLFPHPAGPPFKNALRFLAQHYLKREIQRGEHDSVEDALIAAHLIDLKLTHGHHFGISSRTSILKMVPNTLLNCPLPYSSTTVGSANEASAQPQRTGATSSEHCNPPMDSHPSQPIVVAMIDSPAVLRIISGCGAHCVPIPSNNDDLTCKKAEKFLRKRSASEACGDVESETETSTSSHGAFLLWLQLRDHVICATGAEEAEQLAAVQKLNDNVMRVVAAAPNKSLVLVIAANCRGGNGNRLSKAQGLVFAFIKDSNARGPTDAQHFGRDCKTS